LHFRLKWQFSHRAIALASNPTTAISIIEHIHGSNRISSTNTLLRRCRYIPTAARSGAAVMAAVTI